MALSYLIRTQNDSTCALDPVCFTKQNFKAGYDNATITALTPNGVLGGSVAALSDNYTVVPADGTNTPFGLFVNDAAGRAWESNQAIASNKITIARGMPHVEVDVFETFDAYLNANDYLIGQSLYASAEGFLTNVPSTDATVIGIVTKVPTTASPTLGVAMRI